MKKLVKLALAVMVLVLSAMPAYAAPPAQTPEELKCVQDVVIKKDDWLSKIALKYFGDQQLFPVIIEATNQKHQTDATYAQIDNQDILEVGWKLCIIDAAEAAKVNQRLSGEMAYTTTENVGKLTLATTTSTRDAGLLPYILPDFEAKYQAKVEVVAVGSGQALELGKKGDADVLLVHSPAAEKEFVKGGFGVNRRDVMYNDFVIVGPSADPAGIRGITSAAEAFKKIAASSASFVSRGDGSGTDVKEKSLWKLAGIEPKGDWYKSVGQGMGVVLTQANEMPAYTLSDRATYLARTKEGLKLEVLVEKDNALFNPYGIIAVNPEQHANVNYAGAMTFIDWLTSLPVQEKIAEFGKADFGQSLFVPDSVQWRTKK
jgi:tungstate transport system substrate-binding protein